MFCEIVGEKRGMATAIVAERDGMVHVINISKHGKLHLVKSLDVVPSSKSGDLKVVRCTALTKRKNQVFVGGHEWWCTLKVNLA